MPTSDRYRIPIITPSRIQAPPDGPELSRVDYREIKCIQKIGSTYIEIEPTDIHNSQIDRTYHIPVSIIQTVPVSYELLRDMTDTELNEYLILEATKKAVKNFTNVFDQP